ncbi:hypothetical protein TESG_08648 [Trichophyton tonsurans CBS 112818]|uniref:Uncharacterized protein n=1 Tax=Trichophyton tonsurans (strain CBS 112818) TaxID=647933 RepID=F2S9Z3_TRIT1|nr:hypothetical protein TESG_08648 [Trichophyton tonsurans CBS 112818]
MSVDEWRVAVRVPLYRSRERGLLIRSWGRGRPLLVTLLLACRLARVKGLLEYGDGRLENVSRSRERQREKQKQRRFNLDFEGLGTRCVSGYDEGLG